MKAFNLHKWLLCSCVPQTLLRTLPFPYNYALALNRILITVTHCPVLLLKTHRP